MAETMQKPRPTQEQTENAARALLSKFLPYGSTLGTLERMATALAREIEIEWNERG